MSRRAPAGTCSAYRNTPFSSTAPKSRWVALTFPISSLIPPLVLPQIALAILDVLEDARLRLETLRAAGAAVAGAEPHSRRVSRASLAASSRLAMLQPGGSGQMGRSSTGPAMAAHAQSGGDASHRWAGQVHLVGRGLQPPHQQQVHQQPQAHPSIGKITLISHRRRTTGGAWASGDELDLRGDASALVSPESAAARGVMRDRRTSAGHFRGVVPKSTSENDHHGSAAAAGAGAGRNTTDWGSEHYSSFHPQAAPGETFRIHGMGGAEHGSTGAHSRALRRVSCPGAAAHGDALLLEESPSDTWQQGGRGEGSGSSSEIHGQHPADAGPGPVTGSDLGWGVPAGLSRSRRTSLPSRLAPLRGAAHARDSSHADARVSLEHHDVYREASTAEHSQGAESPQQGLASPLRLPPVSFHHQAAPHGMMQSLGGARLGGATALEGSCHEMGHLGGQLAPLGGRQHGTMYPRASALGRLLDMTATVRRALHPTVCCFRAR